MKSRVLDLCEKLLGDLGARCGVATHRSVKTLRARCEGEGLSFITITLPAFAKDFERSLDEGRLAPGSFRPFGKDRSGKPRFLGEFLRQIFAPTGVLRTDARVDCIRAVRQICLFCKKILLECSEERQLDAVRAFVACEQEVVEQLPDSELARAYRFVAKKVIGSLALDVGPEAPPMAKHGPGATVEGITGNSKWSHRTWHQRLEDVGYTYFLGMFGKDSFPFGLPLEADEKPVFLEPGEEPPVRVVLVPKTLTSPRVIAIEPVCMQFAQQGLKALLVEALERGPYTAGRVNFSDQSVNQRMALVSSETAKYATLDMSEASDRVGYAHAREAFASAPSFWAWAQASRSLRAKLPTGEVLDLRKFASMGSALTFPVEATIFFLVIVASRMVRSGRPWSASTVLELSRDVYVYGDDLIVPTDEAPSICVDLEAFGFKVNRRKSFWTGQFRESCGVDAYAGEPVTPVYLRRLPPADRADASGILSSIATSNQLWQAGLTRTALALRKWVEGLLGPLPMISSEAADALGKSIDDLLSNRQGVGGTPALGWVGISDYRPPKRNNVRLQRCEERCWVGVNPSVPDPLEGLGALAKCLRRAGMAERAIARGQSLPDPEHLNASPRRYGLALKRTWVPAVNCRG